jgi:hypothetical protein
MIKSRRIKRTGYIANIEDKRSTYMVLMGTSEGEDFEEDLEVFKRIILK